MPARVSTTCELLHCKLHSLMSGSAKVSKGEILVYFNEIFDALSKVSIRMIFAVPAADRRCSCHRTLKHRSRMVRSFWIAS